MKIENYKRVKDIVEEITKLEQDISSVEKLLSNTKHKEQYTLKDTNSISFTYVSIEFIYSAIDKTKERIASFKKELETL